MVMINHCTVFLGHWSTSTPTLFITHPGLTLRHIKVLFCQNHEVF